MNDRMLKRRMLSVTPRPGSVVASVARIATRSRMTVRTTTRLSVAFVGIDAVALPEHARRQRFVSRIAEHQERALGRHRRERHVDDAIQDVRQRLAAHERAADFREQLDQVRVGGRGESAGRPAPPAE